MKPCKKTKSQGFPSWYLADLTSPTDLTNVQTQINPQRMTAMQKGKS